MILEQETLELELFKDITIPDLREKEKKVTGAKPSTANTNETKQPPAKPVLTLTNLKDIQNMFAYEADYEILDKAVYSRPPQFKFVTPSREVVQRLIVRATTEKAVAAEQY